MGQEKISEFGASKICKNRIYCKFKPTIALFYIFYLLSPIPPFASFSRADLSWQQLFLDLGPR